jgi:hypothetical protein
MTKKITVVGAGNAGSLTALFFSWFAKNNKDSCEVELVYDPTVPPERVGQATVLEPPGLLWSTTGFNWHNNTINATFKSGILYEGWGKKRENYFHEFVPNKMAMHYCPWEMQKSALDSGLFKVTESNILDLDTIDSDYIIDCRGKPKDYSDYHELKNPTNAAILAKPNWETKKEFWSRHVSTPDGWTFVIPTNESSPSYEYSVGYCYNSDITSEEESEKNFLGMFDVEIKKHIKYKNYVAKNPVIDDRILLNGNRLFFLEPLESSSTELYLRICRIYFDYIFNKNKTAINQIHPLINEIQNFVLWHYQFGSKYDTPFWDYAKTFTIQDEKFDSILEYSKTCDKYQIIPECYGGSTPQINYGQWSPYSFKSWYDYVS